MRLPPDDPDDPETPPDAPAAYLSPPPPLVLGSPPDKRFEPPERPYRPNYPARPHPSGAPPRVGANQAFRIRAAAHMAALGLKTGEIARSLGVTPSRMSVIIASPYFREQVRLIQAELFVNNPQAVFRQMAPTAAQALYGVLTDPTEKGSTKVSAAGEVLDRAYGKATQTIQADSGSVKELFRRLDEERKTGENGRNTPINAEFFELGSVEKAVEDFYGRETKNEEGAEQSAAHNNRLPNERQEKPA